MKQLFTGVLALLICFSNQLLANETYCESGATYTGFEFISRVVFNEIDNNSESTAYTDYTGALSTTCYVGESYQIAVTTDKYAPNDKLYSWIDWNQNLQFEENEKYAFDFSGTPSQHGNGELLVTIPENAVIGATVIRIVLQETVEEPAPCGIYSYGETEDYQLIVAAVTEAPVVNFSSSEPEVFVNGTARISDLSSNVPTSWNWIIEPESYQFINETNQNSQHIELQFFEAASYSITLEASNEIGSASLTQNDFIQVKNYSAPKNLTAFSDANRVLLQWNKPNIPAWKGYLSSIYDCNQTTWEGTERATFFDDENFDFSYPLTLSKLGHGFFMDQNNPWPNNHFKFRIYAADGTTLLFESEEISAQHSQLVEYTFIDKITLNDDFYVSIVTSDNSGQPSSLYATMAPESGHSFIKNSEGDWEYFSAENYSYEFCTQVYLANDDKKSDRNDEWALIGYELYRNHEKIQQIDNPETQAYEDLALADDTYTYYLKALYTGMLTSAISNQVSATVDNSVSDIKLSYQNQAIELNQEVKLAGNVSLEEYADLEFLLENPGLSALEITSVQLDNDVFEIIEQPATNVLPGESTAITIRFTPINDGPQQTTLTLSSNDPNEDPFTFKINAIGGQDQWTWMLYLLEDATGLDGKADINEWEINGSIDGQVNYVVLYNSSIDERDGIYLIEKDNNSSQYEIVSQKIDDSFGVDFDMSDWHTLRDFMLWTKDNFPAKHYGLTMWDHGDGIFKSGKKERKDITKGFVDGMTLWEMDKALAEFTDAVRKKVDIIGFDVCLLGQIETVYQMRNLADYVIASELTEPGDGWDYDAGFRILNENPDISAEALAANIVETYLESYEPGGSSYVTTSTQTATSTEALNQYLIPALNKMSEELIKYLYDYKSEIKTARDKAWAAPNANGYGEDNPNHRDLGHFLANISENENLPQALRTEADSCLVAYYKAIVAEGSTQAETEDATGLKIFMHEDISSAGLEYNYYTDTTNYLKFGGTLWDEYLIAYEHPDLYVLPTAQFEVSNVNPFVDELITLADASFGNPQNWEWIISPTTYEFVNGTAANSQNPEIKFLEKGSYTLTLKVSNTAGSTELLCESCIEVKEGEAIHTNSSVFQIYPNPGTGIYHLSGDIENLEQASIEVIAAGGSKLLNAYHNRVIDLSEQADGVYVLRIIFPNKIFNTKLVKTAYK